MTASGPAGQSPTDDVDLLVRPGGPPVDVAVSRGRPRPGRWAFCVVLAAVAVALAYFLITNPNFEWDVVAVYLFDPTVLRGLLTSVMLAIIAMVLGTAIGAVLAVGQLSDFAPTRLSAQGFVAVFRSIPPLVQLIFWFNLGYLVPTIMGWRTIDLITPLLAAIIGLTLHGSAYMAEIIRSGLSSVDHGQRDAAKAVGFTPGQSFFRVVVPQAMRVILPPLGNQFITTVKGTSLVSVIAMSDLLFSVQVIANRTYQIVPMLLVACIWYLVVITVLTAVQRRIERRYGRGFDAVEPPRKRKGRA